MKCVFRLIAICAVSMVWSLSSYCQEVNTQGRDFWVSFLPNSASDTPKTEILVAGQHPCTGVAKNPHTGWSASFTVKPGEVTSVLVPVSEGTVQKENAVEYKGIHVTTTEEVSLYASNFVTASYDVANVLPTAILMDNYIAQSHYSGPQSNMNSKMLIVAVEDNTEITVDPKGGLRGVFPPYSKKDITLNAGECYLFISAADDISGTAVNVKNGKKVAVFSGGEIAIPNDQCCYDLVFEQCVPMSYWGRHFVVTATAMRKNDMVRITSLAPGCSVSINGKHRKTLGAKKYFDYKLDSSKHEAVYISASSPISVCVYLTSADMGGIMGDPSMVNINPIEQQMDKVTFCTYNTVVSNHHYVNIVTQTSQVDGITLDGRSIASEFAPVPKKEEMSYARISVAHGSHTLEATSGGFVAHVYGLGSYESYAYTVGSSSRVFNQFDDKGNLILSTLPEETEDTVANTEITDLDDETEPTYSHADTLPAVEFGSITIHDLKRGGEIRGVIDPGDLIIDPEVYDISADSDIDPLLKDIDVDIDVDTISLGFHPRNKWCDCFIPKRIRGNVNLVPKTREDGDVGKIVIPYSVPVEKENSWLSRCLWVLVLIGSLVVFQLYLVTLLRKKRFKKDSSIKQTYFNYHGNEEHLDGPNLRSKSFVAWFSRWFLPGDERRTLPFDSPSANLRFIAGANETVKIPKDAIDTTTMRINGYDFKHDSNPQEPVVLGDNDRVVIVKQDGDLDGYLTYSSGGRIDGGGYRIFLFILLLLSALASVTLLIMMIRGLL